MAGVDGNGKNELAETLAGMRRARGVRVRLDGREITRARVAARERAGGASADDVVALGVADEHAGPMPVH